MKLKKICTNTVLKVKEFGMNPHILEATLRYDMLDRLLSLVIAFTTILILCYLILLTTDLNDLWRGSAEFHDLIFMTLIIMPIFLTIVFKSTLYSGWRHLYFIYPFVILIGLNALKIIYIRINLARMYNIKKILLFTIEENP